MKISFNARFLCFMVLFSGQVFAMQSNTTQTIPYILFTMYKQYIIICSKDLLKNNWLPLTGLASCVGYCIYNRNALPQTITWTKKVWQEMPTLVKGAIVYGAIHTLFCKKSKPNITLINVSPFQPARQGVMDNLAQQSFNAPRQEPLD